MKNLILIAMLFCAGVAWAQEPLPADKVIQCGLGEARGEGFLGLQAVFEAIRNRGTLNGVYGCKAVFSEPKWVWDMAKRAYEASKHSNLVKGASIHWHSSKEPEAWWEKYGNLTTVIGSHKFYKEVYR